MKPKAARKLAVSDLNLRKTAQRVLNGQALVSPELEYLHRSMGNTATQEEMDSQVAAVRRLPWSSIVLPD